ncbi:6-carboxytetrahydropterin synthase [Bacteriovoracaceae bacterium]|nr:6-carboxytetrahydropterin synthase [Bacteriovoracaceae bacterium]
MKTSLFYQNVTVLDYAYLDDNYGLVGDALHVNVEFIGETDEEGILFDFSHAKKKVKSIIDQICDHRCVLPKSALNIVDGKGKVHFNYGPNDTYLDYEAPLEAYCAIPYSHINKTTISSYLETEILKEMPKNVKSVSIELTDEDKVQENPFFHYTHGLKDHYGNCQRLFHGHKNIVDIFVNGKKSPILEKKLCEDTFKGSIHFAYWENVQNKDEILNHINSSNFFGLHPELPKVEIKYTSSQGEFSCQLPGREVFFLEIESTVENLSFIFANIVKKWIDKSDKLEVRAYEGIAKGARTIL